MCAYVHIRLVTCGWLDVNVDMISTLICVM